MPSELEERISLALQAYTSNHIPSLRATANTYDAPFETLRERHLGVLSREETIPHSQKFSNVHPGVTGHPACPDAIT